VGFLRKHSPSSLGADVDVTATLRIACAAATMFSAWAKEMGFTPAPMAASVVNEDESTNDEAEEEEKLLPEHWKYRPPLFSETRGFLYEVAHPSWVFAGRSAMSDKLGRRIPGQLIRVYDYDITRTWCRVETETRRGRGCESGWMLLTHDTLGPMLNRFEGAPQFRPRLAPVDPAPQPTTSSSNRASGYDTDTTGADEPLVGPPTRWRGEGAPLVMAKKPMPPKLKGRGRGGGRDAQDVAAAEKPPDNRAASYERAGDGGLGIDVTSPIWEANTVIKLAPPAVREALAAEEKAKEEAEKDAASAAFAMLREAEQREAQENATQASAEEGLLYEVVNSMPVFIRTEPSPNAQVMTRRVAGQVLEVFNFDSTGCWGQAKIKWKKGIQMGWVLLSSGDEALLQPYWLLDGEDRQDVLKR